jgi:hypothetical protein
VLTNHTEGGLIIAPKEPIDEGLRFTSEGVAQLAGKGVDIRALMRTPEKARSPHGVVPVKGDPSDVDAVHRGEYSSASCLTCRMNSPRGVVTLLKFGCRFVGFHS